MDAVATGSMAQLQAVLAAPDGGGIARSFRFLSGVFAFLQQSEAQMLAMVAAARNRSDPPPVPAGGDPEFGLILYWLHHPPAEIATWLAAHKALKDVFDLLAFIAPPTKIDATTYVQLLAELGTAGLAGSDGTLYATQRYYQLDPLWVISVLNYVADLDQSNVIPFPANPPAAIALTPKQAGADGVVLGIVGDWGTGYYQEPSLPALVCPAKRVIDQMTGAGSPAIDYLIHLGDVYYAGTPAKDPPGQIPRDPPGEETTNFTTIWPDQGSGRNFTLNSNHEMYAGGWGYFGDALKDAAFSAQQGASYFSMTYGKWLVLGIDSAYFAEAAGRAFYMSGGLGSIGMVPPDPQLAWLAGFSNHDGPILVMTHHDACDLTGAHLNRIYTDVYAALGNRAPTMWYWGHVHNAIVYEKLGTADGVDYPTLGRCCGHGAIPFGDAWGLQDSSGDPIPNIAYFAHTPDAKLPGTPRVRNGYALVTLTADGGCTEDFYETDTAAAVWSKTWSAGELAG